MIKRGSSPARCSVAIGAIRGRECRPGVFVHGSRGRIPEGQMAARISAISRSNHQIVIVVDVAQGAGDIGVPGREQETGRAVIKYSGRPTRRVMAR